MFDKQRHVRIVLKILQVVLKTIFEVLETLYSVLETLSDIFFYDIVESPQVFLMVCFAGFGGILCDFGSGLLL